MKSLIRFGENGALEYTAAGVGESTVALFFALVRGIPDSRLEELINDCINDAIVNANPDILADLFVMVLQTRDCRGGKGERDLFYCMILKLYKIYPQTVLMLMTTFKEFGYFKDYFHLLELVASKTEQEFIEFKDSLMDVVVRQLQEDHEILESGNGNRKVSLCAKYAPREGKKYDKSAGVISIYDDLRNALFPGVANSRVVYRKLVVRLSAALDVAETKMCAKRFRDLDFAKVPSVCVNKCRKAFLNETLQMRTDLTDEQEVTGNRHPRDQDRVQCRANLRRAILEKGLSGKQLYPHEIVSKISWGKRLSGLEGELLNAQWGSIRECVLRKIAENTATAAGAVNVGKLVPLVDVSGSMSGIPMEVAIALGILISEINQPVFRDRLLTFESRPTWVDLSRQHTIREKVMTTRGASAGGSTNIQAAFQVILRIVEEQHLTPQEVPDLIIFSDMQFDQACGGGKAAGTQLDQIKKMFHDVGVRLCGQPYPTPKIIFWNLRGDTGGFPTTASAKNVQMLSGYSPALLKFVLEGEPLNASGEKVTGQHQTDPYETMRRVLDDARYDSVRAVLSESQEGQLKDYHFTPTTITTTTTAATA